MRKMVKAAFWICLVALTIISVAIYFILKWRQGRPLFHHFQASNIWKAFVLNSIATTIVIFIAVTVKQEFDTYHVVDNDDDYDYDDNDDDNDDNDDKNKTRTSKPKTNFSSAFLTLSTTFVVSLLAYTIMYTLFGFGGGMLINSTTPI